MAHSPLAKHFCAICGYRRRKPLPQLIAISGVTNDTTLLHVLKWRKPQVFTQIVVDYRSTGVNESSHIHTHTYTYIILQECSLILLRSESWFRSLVFILLYVFILTCLLPLPFSSAICQRSTFSEMVYGLKYVYLLRVLFKAAHIRGTRSDQKTYINPPRLPPDRFFFSSTHSLQFFILFILFNTEVDSRWIPYSVDQTQSHTNYSYISLYYIFLHSK